MLAPTPDPRVADRSAPGFDTVLIANRGVIACRIIRSLHSLGLKSVAVYSEADADSAHVAQADHALCIGPAPVAKSYLDAARILAAARESGAGAIHPGYGFLSENPDFAQACEAAGIAFIGPTPQQMRAFGLKHMARALAQAHGVPLLPGSGLLADLADAMGQARRIGYPVMLKSSAGGGGIGMADPLCRGTGARVCRRRTPCTRQLQGRRPVPGEICRTGTPYRGAVVRRWPRQGGRAR